MAEDATWLALTLVLTVLAGAWTWYAARRRGISSGLRGAAITLVPPAAYLTGTLEAGVRIVDVVVDWGTDLVFSPRVWVGVGLAGLSALLFVVAGFVRSRQGEAPPDRTDPALPAAPRAGAPAIDDDLSDIEAILKKRGIS